MSIHNHAGDAMTYAALGVQWDYTGNERRMAVWQARCHFLRRHSVAASMAGHIAATADANDGWRLLSAAHGVNHTRHVVGELTARYLRWNRGARPLDPATFS